TGKDRPALPRAAEARPGETRADPRSPVELVPTPPDRREPKLPRRGLPGARPRGRAALRLPPPAQRRARGPRHGRELRVDLGDRGLRSVARRAIRVVLRAAREGIAARRAAEPGLAPAA